MTNQIRITDFSVPELDIYARISAVAFWQLGNHAQKYFFDI